MDLYDGVMEGNKRCIARLITLVENGDGDGLKIYERLYPLTGRARRIGITGPPGAGKSTLIDLLAREFLSDGYKTGVIAVDPTSPYTGGAVLGDRIRMNGISGIKGCYVRSMATRGQLGGISGGTADAANILDAAGYDYIFIETVGTGQTEIDIVKHSDIVILTAVPGLGDDIQAFKAGIMEIGDIIVINKADREDAQTTYRFISSMINLKQGEKPNILLTDCVNKRGIGELKQEIKTLLDRRVRNGKISKRREETVTQELLKNISTIAVDIALKSNKFSMILGDVQKKNISPAAGARLLINYLCSREGDYDI